MPEGIITDRSTLIRMANEQCGGQVYVEHGATARVSNKGNLVIEHPDQGTQDVCRDGDVLSRNQPLQHGHAATSVTFDRHGDVDGVTPPDSPAPYRPSAPTVATRNSP